MQNTENIIPQNDRELLVRLWKSVMHLLRKELIAENQKLIKVWNKEDIHREVQTLKKLHDKLKIFEDSLTKPDIS